MKKRLAVRRDDLDKREARRLVMEEFAANQRGDRDA